MTNRMFSYEISIKFRWAQSYDVIIRDVRRWTWDLSVENICNWWDPLFNLDLGNDFNDFFVFTSDLGTIKLNIIHLNFPQIWLYNIFSKGLITIHLVLFSDMFPEIIAGDLPANSRKVPCLWPLQLCHPVRRVASCKWEVRHGDGHGTKLLLWDTLPETNSSPLKKKWMVGILLSYWKGLFSGAMLVSGRVPIIYNRLVS